MIYTNREKLTRYVIQDENDKVYFSELGAILMERPSNVIYCEKDNKLFGIISMGDITRASGLGKDFVVVNKRYTSVKLNEYMRVKRIFKDNGKINALPVVSDFNELIGAYSRWEDFIGINDFEQLKLNVYAIDFWKKNRKFALVRPCKEFAKKQELLRMWKDSLLQVGVQVFIINREEVLDTFDFVDNVFFTDEDELRGTGTLYHNILGKKFNWEKARTYSAICKAIDEAVIEAIDDALGDALGNAIFKSLLANDIHVLTVKCEDNQSDYWKMLQKDIADKFSKIGKRIENILHEEFIKDFFAELYNEEYVKEILSHQYAATYIDGINKLKNADRETYKVINGERRTVGQPSDFHECVYFYGQCFIIGLKVEDKNTIESFLQARLNDEGYKVKCVNYGVWADQLTEFNRVLSTRFNKGDIVIVGSRKRNYEGVPSINLVDICEKHKVPATWMIDSPGHSNHKLNRIYADEIFEIIEPIVREDTEEKAPVVMENDFVTLGYLERYFHNFADMHSGIIGSIVMNCNPFTLGHRYLIEQALRQVDHLIIFVVEEDKSVFTFKERFAMVAEGTRDLKNVTVVPSGNFILSQTTFPEYFLKIEDEDIVQNVEYDITLFAEHIAPNLNITYRFVGEEPDDRVTNEYNEAMKRILPKHKINIVEIPRVKIDGKVISASAVREKLLNGDSTDIDRLIPQTTKKILDMCWE